MVFALKRGFFFPSFARLNCYGSQHCLKLNVRKLIFMQMQHIKQANKVLSEIYCQKNLVKVTKHFATLFVPNKRQILQKKVQTKA